MGRVAAGLPALTLPVSLTASNLPVSVQLVAPWRQDEELIRLGAWLESQLNFPTLVIDPDSSDITKDDRRVEL